MEPSSPKPDCVLDHFIVSAEITTDSASGQERDLGFSGWKNEVKIWSSVKRPPVLRRTSRFPNVFFQICSDIHAGSA